MFGDSSNMHLKIKRNPGKFVNLYKTNITYLIEVQLQIAQKLRSSDLSAIKFMGVRTQLFC